MKRRLDDTLESGLRDIVRSLRIPLAVYAPLALILAGLSLTLSSRRLSVLAALVGGFLFWTLIEYWLHRLVLHMLPRGRVRRYVAGRHVLHHRDPTGYPGIVFLWVSASVAAACFAVFALLLGPLTAASAMSGIIVGYLSYEYSHLASHLESKPLTPWGTSLRSHHLAHHHVSGHHNFAIVLPLWDKLFRTRLP